ncbi:hypothetical protein Tco_0054185 [Tanacetum coccineum]
MLLTCYLRLSIQLAAKRNQERVKSILLLAIPDEYLLKFHNVPDAKSLWEAIKSSLDKAYDRFQKLISQLEVHGAPISKEDINQKFLRSLPSSWNQIAFIMRNKPGIDEIDIDDLYNNLMKRSSSSTSNSQNLAFLSSENTNSTNKVSTASGDIGVSTAGGTSQVPSNPCTHDVACSFFAQPTTSSQLENEDFQQIDEDELEELDLRCQMSARDKTGLGYGIQLIEMSNNSETDSEISLSIFDVRSSDEENTLANDSFSKVDGFHAVPPPITGNFLTPRADISFTGLDEYAIMKKIIKSKTTDLNTKTSETVDDEDDVSEVQTVKTRVDKIGQTSQKQGIGFKKINACFVCKSTDHLIKDCNFHDKQSQEPKLKTMVNTGPRVDKPVWDNTKRINH